MPPPTTTMTIRLPAETVEALDALTARAAAASSPLARVSRSATAAEALRLGMAELERVVAEGLAELKSAAAEPGRVIGEPTDQFMAAARKVGDGIAAMKAAIAARAAARAAQLIGLALAAGWTMPRLADELGLSPRTLATVQKGKRALSRAKMARLEALLDAACT